MDYKIFEAEYVIQKPDQEILYMSIIVYGWVEVYQQFEGHHFAIERLSQGSIINHRSFLSGNKSQVFIKTLTPVKFAVISLDLLDRTDNEEIEKAFGIQSYRIMNMYKSWPLDYIININ